ncbi:response regulator transcription factor [Maribellus sp. YY47]|uniref:response regulator transcription factor n=1 Tax=Maribellus sp. YY47 TaxID=2929486 RepID=UPI002000D91C|nr:response regulator transcription factor [Maribellus sp. YY47]MCK3685305.1 response regulator transcription factor [Maribellus sp. YY47]
MSNIAILENYALFCSGIKPVLEEKKEFKVVMEAKHLPDFLPYLKENSPDIIIIDVIHCANHGIASIKKIKRKHPRIPILLVANSDLFGLFQDYISLGVNGIVFSSSGSKDLLEAVNALLHSEDYFPSKVWMMLKNFLRTKRVDLNSDQDEKLQLTDREIDILRLFCKGLTYKEIGANLHISPRTVESHKKNISSKINVKSTAEMIEFAIQNNLS